MADFDCLIIGGGFFGCRLALELRARGQSVTVVEKEAALLTHASYNNQARVHNGYHYPRSVLTALRSRVNYDRFIADYADCVAQDFTKIYGIARAGSKVSAKQFVTFCKRIGAPIEPASKEIRSLFDPRRIEDLFLVREAAFNALRMRERLQDELAAAGVTVQLSHRAVGMRRAPGGIAADILLPDETVDTLTAHHVYHCTYSSLNPLLRASGLPVIPLKHELAEMALVEMPEPLRNLGVTLMDGPFFSVMPFPARGLHTFSHVRFTPHCSWQDGSSPESQNAPDPHEHFAALPKHSHFNAMRQDAMRYLPALADCVQRDSIWEVKTVLPASEVDDSRPILYRRDHGLPGLTCILGGKLDNIYDVIQELGAEDAAA